MKQSNDATCNSCLQEGEISIITKDGKNKVRDRIDHLPSCHLFKKRPAKHFIKKRWEKQERIANELVGAHATEASGARHKDGDGRRLFEWRVESKQTEATSYRLYWSIWTELLHKCKMAGELPLLHIQINGTRYCAVHPDWLTENCEINQWDVGSINSYSGQKILDFGEINQKSFLLRENLFTKPNVIAHVYQNPNGIDICVVTEYLFKELTKHV